MFVQELCLELNKKPRQSVARTAERRFQNK